MKKSIKNLVIAFSFTPERFSSKYELGVANLKKRIVILKNLVSKNPSLKKPSVFYKPSFFYPCNG